MTSQLTFPEAATVDSGTPASAKTERNLSASVRGASGKKKRNRERELIEAHYRELFPQARAIKVNTAHSGGPIVEVWREGGADVYRPPLRVYVEEGR